MRIPVQTRKKMLAAVERGESAASVARRFEITERGRHKLIKRCRERGTVEPATGASTALLAPHVNTPAMNVFLKMLAEDLGPREHAVVIMDRAGWHVAKKLEIPDSMTILLLPPYSPELNPVENLWHWIKSHHTSNQTYAGYDDLIDGVGAA